MQYPSTHKPLRPWTLAGPLVAAFALAACGGGGGGGAVAGSAGGELTFASAPGNLAEAPPTLPTGVTGDICANINLRRNVDDNLEIPDAAVCVLHPGVRIGGNITLGTQSELYAQGIYVDGNVQGQRARALLLVDSTVKGSVQMDIGAAATVRNTDVDGNIKYDENSGALYAVGNTVGGNLELLQNTGAVVANDNRIDGNLVAQQNRAGVNLNRNNVASTMVCQQNSPAPTGGANVAGDKEDQCANL